MEVNKHKGIEIMVASFYVERAGFLPAIKHERQSDPLLAGWFLPTFEVLEIEHLNTAKSAREYAQIEINRRNEIWYIRPSVFQDMEVTL